MQSNTKNLSAVQKLFGDAYSGRCQKKYRHKKEFKFFRNDKPVGSIMFTFKMTPKELEKELLEFKEMSNADRIVLTWTAVDGFINEEVCL